MREDADPPSALKERLRHRFRDPQLLDRALTHRSYAVEQGPGAADNERLEFLGDAVLELVISHLLYLRYGDQKTEGELTKMRASLVNETQLASQSREIDLGRYLRLGKGEEKSGGRDKPSILADLFEAVIGAMYLDGGFQEVFAFIRDRFEDSITQAGANELGRDYKTALQELTQARFKGIPVYEIEKTTGPDHEPVFFVALSLGGKLLTRGSGRSKKEAEQAAARKALTQLQQ